VFCVVVDIVEFGRDRGRLDWRQAKVHTNLAEWMCLRHSADYFTHRNHIKTEYNSHEDIQLP
jgi:hypothetical protein